MSHFTTMQVEMLNPADIVAALKEMGLEVEVGFDLGAATLLADQIAQASGDQKKKLLQQLESLAYTSRMNAKGWAGQTIPVAMAVRNAAGSSYDLGIHWDTYRQCFGVVAEDFLYGYLNRMVSGGDFKKEFSNQYALASVLAQAKKLGQIAEVERTATGGYRVVINQPKAVKQTKRITQQTVSKSAIKSRY